MSITAGTHHEPPPGSGVAEVIRNAFAALDSAGIAYCLRNNPERLDSLPPAGDIDVIVAPNDRFIVREVLPKFDFYRFIVTGHPGHDFYLRLCPDGRWVKLDVMWQLRYGRAQWPAREVLEQRQMRLGVWVASDEHLRRHEELRGRGIRVEYRWWERLASFRPAGVKRLGPVVAVVGPDGAGKTTLIAELARQLPVGLKVVYLGRRKKRRRKTASPRVGAAPAAGPASAPPRPLREVVFLCVRAVFLWQRLAHGYIAAWRGHLVAFDRHPLEILAVSPQRTPFGAVLERFLCVRLVPEPDAFVLLDAPAEVMYSRKGEGNLVLLDRLRNRYRAVFLGRGATMVSTDADVPDSLRGLSKVVWETLAVRRGWIPPAAV